MPITAQEIRQSLLANDSEFQHLAAEHSSCESELERLLKSSYLNSDDLLREATLKKQKLRLKDRMESMIARQRQKVTH